MTCKGVLISMERTFSTTENSDRRLWKSRKSYTMEDVIVVIVKTMNTLSLKQQIPAGGNLYPDIVHDFIGFLIEQERS